MTRFNMATPGREAAIRTRPEWLADRFALFERYCLPSVGAQAGMRAGQDFAWVIYFDKDTPQPFKDRIAALSREVAFHAYYTGLFAASGWPASLDEVLGGLPPWLLTSRLDNDDALATDYMARTYAAAAAELAAGRAGPRTGIVITAGFIRAGARAYAIRHPSNAFTSWLEHTEGGRIPRTNLGIAHIEAASHGPLVQVPGPGGWLQVVHGANVSNKVRGRRVAPAALAGRLPPGATEGLAPVGALRLAAENALIAPLRDARDGLAGLVRALRRR
jgi:hypothetical protein